MNLLQPRKLDNIRVTSPARSTVRHCGKDRKPLHCGHGKNLRHCGKGRTGR